MYEAGDDIRLGDDYPHFQWGGLFASESLLGSAFGRNVVRKFLKVYETAVRIMHFVVVVEQHSDQNINYDDFVTSLHTIKQRSENNDEESNEANVAFSISRPINIPKLTYAEVSRSPPINIPRSVGSIGEENEYILNLIRPFEENIKNFKFDN